ncbi:MAG: hypothetical protein ACLVCH_04240 [Roseburia inulinivorans]
MGQIRALKFHGKAGGGYAIRKKESINALIGAMAEAESKTFYDDTEVLTSDLKAF